jgi:impB/mucB/samB family C-terminal domain
LAASCSPAFANAALETRRPPCLGSPPLFTSRSHALWWHGWTANPQARSCTSIWTPFASVEQRDDHALRGQPVAGVLRMADDVWRWCETAQSFGRTVTVKVKFADFRQITRSRSYPGVVAEHAQLRHASLDLIHLVFPVKKGIRLVGVTVSNFETPVREESGLPLFGCVVGSADMASVPAGLS